MSRFVLWSAVRRNDTKKVIEVLTKRPRLVDAATKDGTTPMHMAAKLGHDEVIRVLVQMGSQSLNVHNWDGDTPLYLATKGGHDHAIETLAWLGGSVNAISNGKWTLMLEAVIHGRISTIELLMSLGSEALELPCMSGHTPVILATLRENKDVIRILHYLGASLTINPRHVFHEHGRNRVAQLFGEYNEVASAETRYRVYFRQSLVYRCLFKMERRNTPHVRI